LTTNDLIHYYSKEHLGILVRVVVIVVTTALVMIPVSLLFTLKTSDMLRLVIVLVFTLVFPTMIAAFTRAKNHEVFAIVAAYVQIAFSKSLSLSAPRFNERSCYMAFAS